MSEHAATLERALARVVEATRVHAPLWFAWFGRREIPVAPEIRPLLPRNRLMRELERALGERLYRSFYCRGAAGRTGIRFLMPDRDWVAQLSSANRSRRPLDGGWERLERRGDIVVVRKDALRLSVAATAVHSRGGALCIETPNEFLDLSPGYYTAVGEAPFDMRQPVIRIYWNLLAGGAIPLVRRTTTLLNRLGIPFRVKVLANPRAFGRCDGGVLYASRSDCVALFEALDQIRQSLAPHLATRVPAFTKRIARGMAVAEEPGEGGSFGESRCALVASALIRGAAGGTRPVAAIEATFARAGIPLQRSFLNPGSDDIYPSLD